MIKLEFTDQELMIINNALIEMPYRLAAPLIKNINEQLPKKEEPKE